MVLRRWLDFTLHRAHQRLMTTRMVRRHIVVATAKFAREWREAAGAAAAGRTTAAARVAAKHRRKALTLAIRVWATRIAVGTP
jgi:hypothetical protein